MVSFRSHPKVPTARRPKAFALQPLGDPALRLGLPEELVRHAQIEAEALAWSTEMPELVFPTLFEETLQRLRRWHLRQQRLLGADASAFAA
jgi:hypothetical protein